MNHVLRWAIRLALVLGALIALGTGAASAQEPDSIDVDAPIDLCGVGVGLLGDSSADCGSPVPTGEPADAAPAEPDAAAILPVGPIGADVSAPVDLCGVGVGLLGDSSADCGSPTPTAQPADAAPAAPAEGRPASTGPAAIIGDLSVDVDAPIQLCGIGIGDTSADCTTSGGSRATGTESGGTDGAPPAPADGTGTETGGTDGAILGGLTGLLDDVVDGVLGATPLPDGITDGLLGDGLIGDGGVVEGLLGDGSVVDGVLGATPLPDGLTDGLVGEVPLDVTAPLDVCGIGVGVLGSSGADCTVEVASITAVPPAVTPQLPSAPTPTGPLTPAVPGDGLPGSTSGGLPLGALDDVARGVIDSVAGWVRSPVPATVANWLAATGARSGLIALAGVGLSFLLMGLVARKHGVPIG